MYIYPLIKKNILTYLDDPPESEFLDSEMPFIYTKDVCNGLPTPSNIWMPIKGKITSASESKILYISHFILNKRVVLDVKLSSKHGTLAL